MNRIAVVLIILLLTSATYPGIVHSTIAPPAQALSAGFRKLGFDEEFKGPLDIGYDASGHKMECGPAVGTNSVSERFFAPGQRSHDYS